MSCLDQIKFKRVWNGVEFVWNLLNPIDRRLVLLPGPPVNIITHCRLGPQADHPVYVFLCDFFTSRLYFACVRVVWDSVGPSLRLSCRAERPPSSPSPVAVGTGFKPRQEAVPTAPRPLHLPLGSPVAPVPSFAVPSTPRVASPSSARRLYLGAGVPELHWSERTVRSSPHLASRSSRRRAARRGLLAVLPVPRRAAMPPPRSSAAAAELCLATSFPRHHSWSMKR
jgi:hypothetical protein